MKKILLFCCFLFIFLLAGAENNAIKPAQAKELQLVITYPQWKLKALSFSYDDANEADRKLVGIFNRYGVKATFHIPALWLTTKPRKRIKISELKTLYAGHEISGHGANHLRLTKLSADEVDREIKTDIEEWLKLSGKRISGYAYPFGSFSPQVMQILKKNGLIYARTTRRSSSFDLPEDFLKWAANGHHINNIDKLGEKYLAFTPQKMSVLLVWGHSYEFARAKNWHIIENFCKQMSGKKEIFYATMGEIAGYAAAAQKLSLENNGKVLKNNSDKTIFFKLKNRPFKLAPGGSLPL